MADENTALIRGLYDAFAQGNAQHILERVTDDVEWVNYGPQSVPYAGSFKGRDGARRFFEAIGSSTSNGKVTGEEFIAAGENVIVLGRYSASVNGTGKQIDVPIAHIFTVRGGKVSRWIGFSDSAAVAEAHGAPALRAAS